MKIEDGVSRSSLQEAADKLRAEFDGPPYDFFEKLSTKRQVEIGPSYYNYRLNPDKRYINGDQHPSQTQTAKS